MAVGSSNYMKTESGRFAESFHENFSETYSIFRAYMLQNISKIRIFLTREREVYLPRTARYVGVVREYMYRRTTVSFTNFRCTKKIELPATFPTKISLFGGWGSQSPASENVQLQPALPRN